MISEVHDYSHNIALLPLYMLITWRPRGVCRHKCRKHEFCNDYNIDYLQIWRSSTNPSKCLIDTLVKVSHYTACQGPCGVRAHVHVRAHAVSGPMWCQGPCGVRAHVVSGPMCMSGPMWCQGPCACQGTCGVYAWDARTMRTMWSVHTHIRCTVCALWSPLRCRSGH